MADEGIRGGGIFIEITPEARDFWTRFVAQNQAGANKAGDDLGDRIGKAISQRIARSVREGLTQGGAGLGAQGTRMGADVGGNFAASLRRRIDAALRNLPTPTIGAATTEAEQKIRDLRNSLDTLRSQKVGVDISAADALAEIRRLHDELRSLSRDSADLQVRADTASAAAQLGALQVQLARLNGQNANVNVRTNASAAARDVNLLVSAGFAIGPAIIPGAVAAAGAILAIGAAATSVAAGIGVGALAFHGIGDAVKALDTAQAQSAKSGATLAGQQKSLASGADQVRSAEAGLANARANAGDAARRSGLAVADAERSVTSAQQDAVRAQRSLNEAREKEIADRQDLAQQLKGNELDREQAALDVAAARAKLAQSNSEQDRINFDQAILRQQNLEIAGRRLTAQQQENAKVGVSGSKQVQAAQQGVVDAQAKVAAAERGVTEARASAASQARQSAAAIASASQAVVTAQRNVGAATVAAAATGGAALDALNLAMQDLPVSGQNFARFIFGLKGDLTDLQTVAADGILPGAQQGIQTLLPYFGDLRAFVGDVATEIGDLERRGAQALTSPFWRSFFSFIASEAVPNMELLYQAGINVAEGGARIVQAFAPVQQQVGGGLLDITERFVAFSRGIETNRGFQNFVAFAQREGPHVVATISELARAGLHVAEAYAPIGSVVVSELRVLGQIINALPVPVITALAVAITAYKTGALLAGGAQALLNSNLLTGIGRMITYRTVTSVAGVTTTGFQRATAGAASFIGGGPFGLAIGIGALALSAFAASAGKANQNTQALRTALRQYADAYKDGVTPAANASAAATLANNSALTGLVDVAHRAGISSADLAAGLNGNAEARARVVGAINDQSLAERLAADAARGGGDADTAASKKHRERAEAIGSLHDAFVKESAAALEANRLTEQLNAEAARGVNQLTAVAEAYGDASASADTYSAGIAGLVGLQADATVKGEALVQMGAKIAASQLDAASKTKLFGQILEGIGSSATTSGPTFEALSGTFSTIASSSLDAKNKVDLLRKSLDLLYGSAINQNEADENLVRTQSSLTTQLNTSSAGFDLNKAKQHGNTAEVLANRDALEAALQAAREKYLQDVAGGVQEDKARDAHDRTVKSILDGVPKTQRQTAAVKELVTEYGAIPPSKKTDVSAPGLDEAIDSLVVAHAVQVGLDQKPPWTKDQIAAEVGYLHAKLEGGGARLFKADGGYISGPGTPTSDSIPAWLSNGEFVQQAAAVDHYGVEFMQAVNQRKIPRQALPGFAVGGAVSGSWPIEILSSPKPPVSVDELWKRWRAAVAAQAAAKGDASAGISPAVGGSVSFPAWPSSPSAQRGDSGVWRSIVALIRSTGPVSGSFGNSYRPGDPLWHGSGRAVDWMGFNQDALASFLASKRPLELIHRTAKRDYAYTRGRDRGSFNEGLMQAHRNHVHIAMAGGGLVDEDLIHKLGVQAMPDLSHLANLYDTGGVVPQGLSLMDNRTRGPELAAVMNSDQLGRLGASDPPNVTVYNYLDGREIASHTEVVIDRKLDRVASLVGSGVRD